MATVMIMQWPGVTRAQYDQVRKDVNWEGQIPAGAKFHVAWFDGDGLRVIDLWESRQHFETFVNARLTPGVARAGIVGQPHVEFAEAHAIFAPSV